MWLLGHHKLVYVKTEETLVGVSHDEKAKDVARAPYDLGSVHVNLDVVLEKHGQEEVWLLGGCAGLSGEYQLLPPKRSDARGKAWREERLVQRRREHSQRARLKPSHKLGLHDAVASIYAALGQHSRDAASLSVLMRRLKNTNNDALRESKKLYLNMKERVKSEEDVTKEDVRRWSRKVAELNAALAQQKTQMYALQNEHEVVVALMRDAMRNELIDREGTPPAWPRSSAAFWRTSSWNIAFGDAGIRTRHGFGARNRGGDCGERHGRSAHRRRQRDPVAVARDHPRYISSVRGTISGRSGQVKIQKV